MKKLILITFISLISSICLADTIYLKSGKKREGKIIEKTDEYIKIDYYGMPVTFFMDEVEKIEESTPESVPAPPQDIKTPLILPSMAEAEPKETQPEPVVKIESPKKIEDFTVWLTHYNESPAPEDLLIAFKIILENQILLSNPSHWKPIAHFFATALQADKSKIADFKALLGQLQGLQKQVLEDIIYDAENFKSPDVASTLDLDMLWGEFLATGKEEPIDKIIKALIMPENKQQIMTILVKRAAKFMLTSNAKKYPKVQGILKNKSNTAEGELKEALEEILQEPNKISE